MFILHINIYLNKSLSKDMNTLASIQEKTYNVKSVCYLFNETKL